MLDSQHESQQTICATEPVRSADGLIIINAIVSDLHDYADSLAIDIGMGLIRNHVIDTRVTNYVIEGMLTSTVISEAVNPVCPLSLLGWLIGLPL